MRNNGPDTAVAVTVADTVPASLEVISAVSSELSCTTAGNVVSCTRASMPSGAAGTVTVTVRVPAGTVPQAVTNVASITSSTADPVSTNNSDDAAVTIGSNPPPPPDEGALAPPPPAG